MADFWNRVQALNGTTLKTRAQGKDFDILKVSSDRVIFVPKAGRGGHRWIGRSWLEQVADLNLDESELTPKRLKQEFPDDQNLSYIAAIVHAAQSKS